MPIHRQIVIVGAGPAGLQLALSLKRLGLHYTVLERAQQVAAFFRKFPRHRRLISINKPVTGFDDPEVNLRWDWHSLLEDDRGQRFPRSCSDYFPLAEEYVKYLEDFAVRNEIDVAKGADVVSITRQEGKFLVACGDGRQYTADDIVVATGLSSARKPDFAGGEYAEPYSDVSIDPATFSGQRVLILGKGNAAFETANNLVETAAAIHLLSPSPLRLASRTRYVGHVRATNASLLDTHSLRSQNTIIDATVERIEPKGNELQVHFSYTGASKRAGRLTVDRVISCLGFALDTKIFGPTCRPQLCHGDRYAALTSAWESVNVPNLYFAGTLMHARDFRRASSGFVHGFRHNIRALARILRSRRNGAAWEFHGIALPPETLGDFMLHRADTAAAIFNQAGFFSDVIVIAPDRKQASVYRDMPLDYFRDSRGSGTTYYTVTMELGPRDQADPAIGSTAGDSELPSTIIHPVIRRFVDNRRVSEYHLPEDLDARWHRPQYIGLLVEWLASDLAAATFVAPNSRISGRAEAVRHLAE